MQSIKLSVVWCVGVCVCRVHPVWIIISIWIIKQRQHGGGCGGGGDGGVSILVCIDQRVKVMYAEDHIYESGLNLKVI